MPSSLGGRQSPKAVSLQVPATASSSMAPLPKKQRVQKHLGVSASAPTLGVPRGAGYAGKQAHSRSSLDAGPGDHPVISSRSRRVSCRLFEKPADSENKGKDE